MNNIDYWLKGREESKLKIVKSFDKLIESLEGSENVDTLKNLIDLFISSHDLVSDIGLEISKLVDSNKKGM